MDKAAQLLANIDRLPPHNHAFARSLASQLQQRGSLSDKQWPHFDRLYSIATGTAAPQPVKSADSFPRIVEMFRKAFEAAAQDGEGFKWPRLMLATADGFKFKITKSATGKHVGTYQVKERVKSAGRIFDMGSHAATDAPAPRWFGRIELDGAFVPSLKEQASPQFAGVLATLREIQANPDAAMKVQGQRTGSCCMCGRELTNAESRARGIGPICAGKWM